jgi:hypothetical protein
MNAALGEAMARWRAAKERAQAAFRERVRVHKLALEAFRAWGDAELALLEAERSLNEARSGEPSLQYPEVQGGAMVIHDESKVQSPKSKVLSLESNVQGEEAA